MRNSGSRHPRPRRPGAASDFLGGSAGLGSLKEACPVPPHCDGRLQIADVSFGRGLVVSSAVAQGELLVVCQALVLAPQAELQAAASEKLKTCSEEEYKNFMCLQGGADELQQASSLDRDLRNWIGNLPRLKRSRKVDTKRVQKVLLANSLSKDIILESGAADRQPEFGCWLLPSLINHSCQPNVAEQFLGDLLLLRASKPMVAGEELLMSYASTLQSRHLRQKYLSETFNFSCICPRCKLEASVLDVEKVQAALEQLDSLTANAEKKTLLELVEHLEGLAKHCRQVIADGLSSAGPAEQEPIQRPLTASFLPVFMGLAFARKRLAARVHVLEAYSVCRDLLAAVHHGSMYHVHWSLETALQAHLQGDSSAVQLRTEALQCCFTFAAADRQVCEALATKAGWPKEMLDAVSSSLTAIQKADLDSSTRWRYSVENEKTFVAVNIMLPEGIEPSDVSIDLAPEKVCVASAGYPDLIIDLPVPVRATDAMPAKYKRSGRKFVLQLPRS
ncbi:Smyd3 [Symbiodinium sp. CCMP2592]|nr:Smyd3 [Symbiodinium sp. CCMP2592]